MAQLLTPNAEIIQIFHKYHAIPINLVATGMIIFIIIFLINYYSILFLLMQHL